MRLTTLTCCLAILFGIQTVAGQISRQQKSIFGLSALAGVNLTQVDGDNFAGFDKFGLAAGLKGIIELNRHFDLNVELIYSEKGSRFESAQSIARGTKDRQIKLSYAEIPMLLVIKLKAPDATTSYHLQAGVSVARLLNTRIEEPTIKAPLEFDFSSIKDEFDSTELNAVLGVHVRPPGNWGFGLRYSGALTKFYEDPDAAPIAGNREIVEFLRNFQLSLLMTYRL
ncbi:MAG: porin family protein [Saprospiraceae bacterium]|nr:porin family protein [Saprospiraceae bacterium]